jgi:methionyl-tRNA formyltransferase
MRVTFIGASRFGLRCLAQIAGMRECEIAGVVTAPRTFAISYRPSGVTNVLHADVAGYCEQHSIECATLEKGMNDPALLERVRGWKPDAFIVVGWYHMVPRAWRALAPAYGMHASLLPDYSGGAPLVWAIINGETRTGISLFQLADGVDDGPVVGQAATEITDDDTIATLYARIEDLGLGLLAEHLPRLADGSARPAPQDSTRRRVVPQRSPEDGRIDWTQPARRVYDFVRAQTRPYPGAFTLAAGNKVTLWSCRVAGAEALPGLAPGTLAVVDDTLLVACGEGALALGDLGTDSGDMPAMAWHASRAAAGKSPVRFDGLQ